MPSPFAQVLLNLAERFDEDFVPALYAAAGRPTEELRAELDEWGVTRHDPAQGKRPSRQELRLAAEEVVARSVRTATMRGAVANLGGPVAVPPELVASGVQALRLAQRLAVLYGHDPESDRGKLLLGRALAAAFELELPRQLRVDFRVRQLPALLGTGGPPDLQKTASLAARAARRTVVRRVGRRIGKRIPGFGTGLAALSARRRLRAQGERMIDFYERTWEGPAWSAGVVEDAVEIAG